MALPDEFTNMLEKQHYKVSNHSAVKLCHWTKQSLLHNRHCYKQQFYGIESHRCLQMTPTVGWCQQKCLFCWRPFQFDDVVTPANKMKWDEPGEVIDGCVAGQKKLLEGYYGLLDRVEKKRLDEAMQPNNAAISLAGEPTLYPKLPELIDEFKNRKFSTFLVTNGLLPEVVEQCEPTNLYLSLDAPTEEIHKRLNIPSVTDSWERIGKTLGVMADKKARTVIRMTMVKEWNMMQPEKYAELIKKSNTDFVEVKAFMLVGASRERLKLENMPRHEEVKAFAEEVAKHAGYKVKDEKADSRVVLLEK